MRQQLSPIANWVLIGLLAVFAQPGFGRQQAGARPPAPVILDVTVVERNGQPVGDLAKDEFAIYEDGVKQQLDFFETKDAPFSLGLVIDASGSMRKKMAAVENAVHRAITRLHQEDEAFLAQFKAEPELIEAFTSDRQKLSGSLQNIHASGGTSLLDAVIATSDYAEEKGRHRRRALLFVTDGLEKNSATKEKEVTTALMENRVQVYFIFLPDVDDAKSLFGQSPAARGKELITRLAEASGGRAFFPKQMSEAASVAEEIVQTLHRQYQISYPPTNQKQDGEWRKLKVEITPKTNRKLTVIVRRGYFAPGHVSEREKERRKQQEKQEKKKTEKKP